MTNAPLVDTPPQNTGPSAATKLSESAPPPVASKLWKGHAYPLGATWTGDGVNFALFSQHATGVVLCLFDDLDQPEVEQIRLTERSEFVWHCFLPDLKPGQLYAFRVEGPWAPANGHRFNRNKVVLDPYALAVAGQVRWGDEMF